MLQLRSFVRSFAKKVVPPVTKAAPGAPAAGGAKAASASEDVDMPLRLFGVGGRYATALFRAAAKRDALEVVEGDLRALSSMSTKAKEFMRDPTVSKKAKAEVILADLSRVKASELTKNFMVVLAENGRLPQIDKIVDSFSQLMSAHRGEVSAVVTSAEPLKEDNVMSLTDALRSFVSEGQTLNVETRVDPSIVGGLIVDIGDRQIDMSVVGRVQKLRTALSAPI